MEGYLGEIRMFGGNYAPVDWLFCNGQQVWITQYQALYSVIGNTFGGDNASFFNLPDLRSRVPVHQGRGVGLSPYKIGQQVGAENVVLDVTQIPSHTHDVNATSAAGSVAPAQGNLIASSARTELNFAPGRVTPDVVLAPGTISATGNSQAHDNIQPSMAVSFIICVQGSYPMKP